MAQTTEDTTPVKLGLNVASYSPTIDLPTDLLETISEEGWEGDAGQELSDEIANWWEDLTVEERVEALSLDEKKGWEIVENLLFIDDQSGDQSEVLWEN